MRHVVLCVVAVILFFLSLIQLAWAGNCGVGFFITPDTLVTAAHIVGPHKAVQIQTEQHGAVSGMVIGVHTTYDVAFIRVSGFRGTPLKLADDVLLGVPVVLYGYESARVFGPLHNSISWGSIAHLSGPFNDRSQFHMDMIVRPGQSGSPIITQDGLVRGMLVSKMSDEYTGVAWAVRCDVIRKLAEKLGIRLSGGQSACVDGDIKLSYLYTAVVQLYTI